MTQLLVELDGFDPLLDVIFVAATNRPDILVCSMDDIHFVIRILPLCVLEELTGISLWTCLIWGSAFRSFKFRPEGCPSKQRKFAVKLQNSPAAILQRSWLQFANGPGYLVWRRISTARWFRFFVPLFFQITRRHFAAALEAIPPLTDPILREFYKNFTFSLVF